MKTIIYDEMVAAKVGEKLFIPIHLILNGHMAWIKNPPVRNEFGEMIEIENIGLGKVLD